MLLLEYHADPQASTTAATAEPITFPTKIVQRMQAADSTKLQQGDSDRGNDFTSEYLRHMLWDYAGNPAPASDLAGLTKRCVRITCITCGPRVIKVTRELHGKIDWSWIQEDLFADFECLYCREQYFNRLEAHHRAKAV